MKLIVAIILCSTLSIGYSQISVTNGCFDSLRIGIETFYDVQERNYFDHLELIQKPKDITTHGNIQVYELDSLHFTLRFDDYFLSSVQLDSGFIGIYNDTMRFEVGKSQLKNFVKENIIYDTKPYYWGNKVRVKIGCFHFVLLNDSSDLIECRIISINLYDFCLEKSNHCRPNYAPDSVTHCNQTCYKPNWKFWQFMSPANFTPFGLWKNYYPNHKLKEIGYFNHRGKKVGTWKYYDFNGNLKEIINYKKSFDANCECKHKYVNPYD